MARRKKKKSDDLTIPEFDETDYMRKEMRHALMMAGTVGLAVFMAIVAGVLTWTLKDARIPFVLGMLGILLLKFIFDLLKIDTSGLEKTKWAGTFFTYFLTFIAIWVLLINPPIVDLIPPEIENATPGQQELGASIGVSVQVSDNQGVSEVAVLVTDPTGNESGPFDMDKVGRNLYWHPIPDPMLGLYEFKVEVKDKGDFFSDADYGFEVVPYEAPKIDLYNIVDGSRVRKGESINVQIRDNAGVVLAWYSTAEVYDPGDPKVIETKLKLKEEKDEVVNIKVPKNWQGTNITINVCAMDSVPHSTVCRTYHFDVGL